MFLSWPQAVWCRVCAATAQGGQRLLLLAVAVPWLGLTGCGADSTPPDRGVPAADVAQVLPDVGAQFGNDADAGATEADASALDTPDSSVPPVTACAGHCGVYLEGNPVTATPTAPPRATAAAAAQPLPRPAPAASQRTVTTPTRAPQTLALAAFAGRSRWAARAARKTATAVVATPATKQNASITRARL